jgi:hypothetical protein
MTPLLIAHIGAGSIGFLTGVAALSVRKGERPHRVIGAVFFAFMLIMAAAASVLAIQFAEPGNVVGGVFTGYLVATAWMAVRRKAGQAGLFEYGAMFVALGVAIGGLALGVLAVQGGKHAPGGPPVAGTFLFAGLAALAGGADLSVILRRGLGGRQRIARHLWRVCFALFVATGSFYTQVVLTKIPMAVAMAAGPWLLAPIAAPLVVMVFWLIRVRTGARFADAV